uniref:NADH-ubiquinone oxidoreductase chain 6 n=1 Tax=Moricella rufonota TaxID=1384683 RepID=A0A897G5F0_9HYME|nr:NADH dehydrogenase subunit 6 [Moricella rufonota]
MMLQIMLIYILLLNSLMFYFSKTPISMGLIIILQTILLSLISGLMSFNFWYIYMMFLIMIGSMLILFIYVSSLSSNQKFDFNKKNIFMMFCIISLMFMMFKENFNLYSTFNSESINLMKLSMEQNFELKLSMNKLYNLPTNKIMLLMMNYLLLTLFIIVEITNINMGPLRKNF